jgi:predicted acetyltransferase
VYNADSKPPTPQGFLIYGEKDRQLIINGFRYNSFGAFTALKNYISAYHDQIDSIHCTSLPENFPIESFIHSYWTGKDQVVFSYEPSKMLRVVSPKAVLKKFVNPTSVPTEPVALLIQDALLPENSGVYKITENKTVQFHGDQTSFYDLEISIQALAKLITGRFSAHELYRCGELRLPENAEISYLVPEIPEKIAILDALFPKVVTFYPEYD